jgi:TolB-like protein
LVEESDGDLMGDGVNIAARLEGVANPGTICLSEQAYWQVKGRLDLKVTDLGPTQLKNIAEPIHVYSLEVGQPVLAKPAPSAAPPEKPPHSKRRSALALLAAGYALLLALTAGGAWYFFPGIRTALVASKPAATPRLSMVVLPFANLSGDRAQDDLVDALTNELTTSLARLTTSFANIPGRFVIAHNTASTYKGKAVDAKAIGRDLGVRYVLEGSVQPSGNQMRVNAQLIDAESGAHLWAEQFDTPRADLLQMQDEIVTHLARAMELQLPEAEAARLRRKPAANPDAEDLVLQCAAGAIKGNYFGKEADAGYALCEQALAVDPKNAHAMGLLSVKYYVPVYLGLSADPKADFARADELVSQALAIDPNFAGAHLNKANLLNIQGRYDEAIAESKLALTLDPAVDYPDANIGWDYENLGQFEKSLEFFDKAIRRSPHDPYLGGWYGAKAWDYFALKQYDQAIDWGRRGIALMPNNPPTHVTLIGALALTGHPTKAHDALQRYLALEPPGPKTIAAWKAFRAHSFNANSDPRVLETLELEIEGLRKAGMPEE